MRKLMLLVMLFMLSTAVYASDQGTALPAMHAQAVGVNQWMSRLYLQEKLSTRGDASAGKREP